MATANDATLTPPAPGLFGIPQTPGVRNIILAVGAAMTIAVMVGVWMWSQAPDYRVLFSNFNDRDGGAIVASLQQLNIPYKYSEGGSAILVPADQVHDVRLKLAAQGLPKGGNVGFELMENQKLGISQFLEQVNFQRALEGELARSIQAVSAVQTARVHLAIPKASVFIREQQKPTASVLLNLYPSRVLDQQQVSAILHLVASSIPELSAKNVTIVDQNGNLLSDPSKQAANNNLDPSQLKYVQEFQQSVVKKVESIISPIVGLQNVRAEASADIDFSRSEQAAESYRPNSPPETSSIRSQQTSESYGKSAAASGVPGALSNQPPAPATAPITGAANTATTANANGGASGLSQKDSTVNFEVDKTIRYTQQAMGGLKRLSVAVVVNYKTEVDKSGKTITRPLTEIEKTQITDLAREAMGFSKERGDTLNVVNSPFAAPEKVQAEDIPLWKQADVLQTVKEVGKYVVGGLLLMYLFFGYLKPTLNKLTGKDAASIKKEKERLRKEEEEEERKRVEEEEAAIVNLNHAAETHHKHQHSSYETNMDMAKQLASSDPKIVANVIKSWVSNE
ncbi:flagellar basal-body MS-ring/collar protein FliF [Undibacterium flavidum]|uniref:Flagellar M-ring protein n=1 Tax=Undibacterium flavidum TaxID=2762297 RepID=A0ABR6Y6Q0_9BURK|nr:flagellar basal-body MS-ring/collar protein FliF [Undibacterium flavidum]MBC3872293.1 flagellar M-ring protein FliF [Undibacterium flavidum]